MLDPMLALIVESWWLAALLLRFLRRACLIGAAVAVFVWPNLANVFGCLSLAILCHVGHRAACRFIIDTAEHCP